MTAPVTGLGRASRDCAERTLAAARPTGPWQCMDDMGSSDLRQGSRGANAMPHVDEGLRLVSSKAVRNVELCANCGLALTKSCQIGR